MPIELTAILRLPPKNFSGFLQYVQTQKKIPRSKSFSQYPWKNIISQIYVNITYRRESVLAKTFRRSMTPIPIYSSWPSVRSIKSSSWLIPFDLRLNEKIYSYSVYYIIVYVYSIYIGCNTDYIATPGGISESDGTRAW